MEQHYHCPLREFTADTEKNKKNNFLGNFLHSCSILLYLSTISLLNLRNLGSQLENSKSKGCVLVVGMRGQGVVATPNVFTCTADVVTSHRVH